ncbi:MAG: trypsin-like peptidase domain-containing protein [Anaerolineae bacterium]|nr:trypsin-like peptidase domain-containing protein [Anaerolineae bacterium]
MRKPISLITSVVALALVAVLAFGAGSSTASIQAAERANPASQPAAVTTPIFVTDSERILHDLYNRLAPSVVSINVVARSSGNTQNPAMPSDGLIEATGTGFVVDTLGHIVTNNHVVDGATRIEVNFFDGRIVRAEIVGLDPDSDLAVIQVQDVPAEDLHPVTLGDSENLYVGQEVVAIGSPFNQPWTLTTGIVSALDRSIRGLTQFSIGSVIQTDAAINPGNSGGPLLNLAGEVIGVNSQIMSETRSNSGIGFAIPSNLVQRVKDAIINTGDVNYSYLGISGQDMNLYFLDALGLPSDTRGIVVLDVSNSSPAAQAGLRNPSNPVQIDGARIPHTVDVITAIDGVNLANMADLIGYLALQTSPGQTVNMTVLRDGQTLNLPITLGAR